MEIKEQLVFNTNHYFFAAAMQIYSIWVRHGRTPPNTQKVDFFRQQDYK